MLEVLDNDQNEQNPDVGASSELDALKMENYRDVDKNGRAWTPSMDIPSLGPLELKFQSSLDRDVSRSWGFQG